MRCAACAAAIAIASDAQAQFKPVDFPKDVGVPDFVFPAPGATIDQWAQTDDVASMAAHAWGLWIGVNMDSGEAFGGQKLRVFETWNEKSELPTGAAIADAAPRPRVRTPRVLRQFRFQNGNRVPMTAIPGNSPLGFVKFDPTAADHIVKNKLLSQQTLDNLLDPAKITNVPDFPNTAIFLKVETVPVSDDPMNPGFFKFSVWPGPPATPQSFGPGKWNAFVWIDLNPANANTGDGSVGNGTDTRKPGNTYSINQFLNLKDGNGKTEIVAGMHMTTREIQNWTWQTFWWTPDATKPPAPSSQQIAAARPKQLLTMGAPAHYAVALAYSMRTSTGGNVFGYNPYLEAGFSGLAGSFPFGVQTNCMSCHANASYKGIPSTYVGNENIDIAGPQFKGQVRLDFLYSLEP
jgi:hypothetical protein